MELKDKSKIFIKLLTTYIIRFQSIKLDIKDQLNRINNLRVLDNSKFEGFDDETKKNLLNRNTPIFEEYYEFTENSKNGALFLLYNSMCSNFDEVFDALDKVDYMNISYHLRDIYKVQCSLLDVIIEGDECHYKDMVMEDKKLFLKTYSLLNVLTNSLYEVRSNLLSIAEENSLEKTR